MELASCWACGMVVDLKRVNLLGHEEENGYHDCCWVSDSPCYTWKCTACNTTNDTDKEL